MITGGSEVVDALTEMTTSSTEARRRELLGQIAELGPVLSGSITERRSRCGNPRCRCQHDPHAWHGPYFVWTRKLDGKTVSKNLTAEQAATYRTWLTQARRLHELVAELEQLGAEAMAATEGWAPPPPPPPDRRRQPHQARAEVGDRDS